MFYMQKTYSDVAGVTTIIRGCNPVDDACLDSCTSGVCHSCCSTDLCNGCSDDLCLDESCTGDSCNSESTTAAGDDVGSAENSTALGDAGNWQSGATERDSDPIRCTGERCDSATYIKPTLAVITISTGLACVMMFMIGMRVKNITSYLIFFGTQLCTLINVYVYFQNACSSNPGVGGGGALPLCAY